MRIILELFMKVAHNCFNIIIIILCGIVSILGNYGIWACVYLACNGFMPRRVVDLLACWTGRSGKFREGNCWKAIPLCLMWFIWCEWNNRAFEGIRIERRTMELKMIILRSLF